EKVSDAALMALAPANPPSAGKAFDPIRDTNVYWKTPSKTAEDAMPIGNGKVLASVWTNADGDVRVTIARIPKPGEKAEILGGARFRITPGLSTAPGTLEQTLLFKYGEVVVKGPAQPSK
ncbi:MAG TPA: hypothetical protein DD471_01965, partial [Planctomycetes bacterium]|nr:hypothetical protein [Planctomycetota bacterium]